MQIFQNLEHSSNSLSNSPSNSCSNFCQVSPSNTCSLPSPTDSAPCSSSTSSLRWLSPFHCKINIPEDGHKPRNDQTLLDPPARSIVFKHTFLTEPGNTRAYQYSLHPQSAKHLLCDLASRSRNSHYQNYIRYRQVVPHQDAIFSQIFIERSVTSVRAQYAAKRHVISVNQTRFTQRFCTTTQRQSGR